MIGSLCIGASTGLRQLVIPFIMVDILPKSAGLAVGLGAMASSFSVVFFTGFGQYVMNPFGKNPTIQFKEGERIVNYFDYGVSSQFPWYTFYVFCICVFIGTVLVPMLRLKGSKKVEKNSLK